MFLIEILSIDWIREWTDEGNRFKNVSNRKRI